MYSIKNMIKDLNLEPSLSTILEDGRPLTNGWLRRLAPLTNQIKTEMGEVAKRGEFVPEGFWFGVAVEYLSGLAIFPTWHRAVLRGVAHGVYTGLYNDSEAFKTICLAGGSALRRKDSEPFRVALSILHKFNFRPIEGEAPSWIELASIPRVGVAWASVATTYGSLRTEVKAAGVVEALALGLGVMVNEGLAREEASEIFFHTTPYRASSPISQLRQAETRL